VGRRSETVTAMTDHFGLVVEPLDGSVADRQVEVVEDVLLVPFDGPGKIADGLESGVGGPPEPSMKEVAGLGLDGTFPELTEAFLEQPGAMAAQIELLQITEPGTLGIGEIFDIFEPEIARPHKQVGIGFLQLYGFFTADRVDRPQQLLHDVKAIVDESGMGQLLLDHVDVGLPHVAADRLDAIAQRSAMLPEEPAESLLGAARPGPQQALLLQIIDVGDVDMPFALRQLVDADVEHSPHLPVRQPVGYRLADRQRHGAPVHSEQPGHLLPGKQLAPVGQHPNEPHRQSALALAPGDGFHAHLSAPRAGYPRRSICQCHRHAPQRRMPPGPRLQAVPHPTHRAAGAAGLPAIPCGYPVGSPPFHH
jgi:hypothetical protein